MTTSIDGMSTKSDHLAQLAADLAARPYARRGIPSSNDRIRIMLVDDHAMVREGLRVLLRTAHDITVVGEADNGVEAVAVARRLLPDIIVLDLDMPGGPGAVAVRELGEALPQVKVLILTVHAERDRLLPLLEAGAKGYLTKTAASRDLLEAIRVVAAGEIYVRPSAARLLAAAVVPERTIVTASSRFRTLSDREQTILRMVAEGYSGAEVARRLNISSKTVDAYKRRVQEKLGLEHRTDYVRFAIEAGILGRPA
jgi:DNA-binding NarL/FixJ family response regulator